MQVACSLHLGILEDHVQSAGTAFFAAGNAHAVMSPTGTGDKPVEQDVKGFTRVLQSAVRNSIAKVRRQPQDAPPASDSAKETRDPEEGRGADAEKSPDPNAMSSLQQFLANVPVPVIPDKQLQTEEQSGLPGAALLKEPDQQTTASPWSETPASARPDLSGLAQKVENANAGEVLKSAAPELMTDLPAPDTAISSANIPEKSFEDTVKSFDMRPNLVDGLAERGGATQSADLFAMSDEVRYRLSDNDSSVVSSLAAGLTAQQIITPHDTPKVDESAASVKVQELPATVQSAAEKGTAQMVVRLDPPDLGHLEIRLKMVQGVLTADLRVQSGSTKDILASTLPQIRSHLEQSGIRVGELMVDLHDDYVSGQGRQQEQETRKQNRQNRPANDNFLNYLA